MTGKILGVGLSRTGTTSLTEALRLLGFSAKHYPRTLDAVEAHDAATDTPVARDFKVLDRRFPSSRFILTMRDEGPWLASCEKMWRRRQGLYDSDPFTTRVHRDLYGGRTFDRARFADARERHHAAVDAHFQGRDGDLLVIDISRDPDPWTRICAFLDRPVPDAPFPHANDTAAIERLIADAALSLGDAAAADISGVPVELVREIRRADPPPAEPGAGGWEVDLIQKRLAERESP